MTKLPLAKRKDMLVQEAGDEVLIYNLQNNRAYCLNKTAGIIWQNCDGKQTFEGLRKLDGGLSEDVIMLSLSELQKSELLESDSEKYWQSDKHSRRAMIGKFGSVAVALPIVSMIVAPKAVSAQSGCGTVCTAANGTAICVGTTCQITACNPGFANCDGAYATGCEVNLLNSPLNCGTCGNQCNPAQYCQNGVCM